MGGFGSCSRFFCFLGAGTGLFLAEGDGIGSADTATCGGPKVVKECMI